MDYTIYPFEGVGAIKFGMTPEQVHEIWGEPEQTLLRDPEEDGYDSDEDDLSRDYTSDNLNVQINHDKRDEKVFRESNLTDLATDDTYFINPTFQGREVFGQTMKGLKSWLKSLGTAIQPTDYGYIFLKFGIGAYAQDYSPFDKFDFLVETLTVSSAEASTHWLNLSWKRVNTQERNLLHNDKFHGAI